MSKDSPRVAVLGAGANGAAIGAALANAGRDVTLIEQWPAHVEAIRADGLLVRTAGHEERTRLEVRHLCEVAELRQPFDLVLLAVKAYDTRWACELIAPVLAKDGAVAGVQNGMTIDAIAGIVGSDRTLGAVIEVAANMYQPGVVDQQAPPWFAVGAVDERAHDWVAAAVTVLADAGSAQSSSDIRSSKWMKLVVNSAELVTSAICGLPLAAAGNLPRMREVMLAAGREAMRVAAADGAALMPVFGVEPGVDPDPVEFADRLLEQVLAEYTLSDSRTTVLQDWDKGRRGEVDDLNGHVLRTAGRLDIEAPVNRRVVELAHEIEAGTRVMSPKNADELATALGGSIFTPEGM